MSYVQYGATFAATCGLIIAQACQRFSRWTINEWFRGRL